MKKLFKKDTILAMVIPFVFFWTSQPLGIATKTKVYVKEYRVRSIEEYNKHKDFDLI